MYLRNTLIPLQCLPGLVSIVTSSAHCTRLAHTWRWKRHSSVCSAEKYGHLATLAGTMELRWWEEGRPVGLNAALLMSLYLFSAAWATLLFVPIHNFTLVSSTSLLSDFICFNDRHEYPGGQRGAQVDVRPREIRGFKCHEINIRAEKKERIEKYVLSDRCLASRRQIGEAPFPLISEKFTLKSLTNHRQIGSPPSSHFSVAPINSHTSGSSSNHADRRPCWQTESASLALYLSSQTGVSA